MDEEAQRAFKNNAATLAISLHALQEDLRRSLVRLCKASDASTELKWFSELEADLVHRAKHTMTEGISMSDEIIIIDGAMDHLHFVFNGIRKDVMKETEGE
jgi:hypothetical protein